MLFPKMLLSVSDRPVTARVDARTRLLVCLLCGVAMSAPRTALADFVGLTTANKAELPICQDTSDPSIDVPLTVCNIFAGFDDPLDELTLVDFAEIQVFDGLDPDVFFQHPAGTDTSPNCGFLPVLPSLACDSFVTIGLKCFDGNDGTLPADFDSFEFNNNGHLTGGWLNTLPSPSSAQGVAGTYPDNQVLIAQLSVAQGLRISGTVDITWRHDGGSFVTAESVAFVCEAEGGVDWTEHFESYPNGNCMDGEGGWEGWLGDVGADACLLKTTRRSFDSAVDISGNADLVRVFTGFDSGVWNLCTWQFIPNDFSGGDVFHPAEHLPD